MGKPDSTNPSTKPQDDKKQSGTDPIGKHQNPGQHGQGRDPSKDQGRQKSSGVASSPRPSQAPRRSPLPLRGWAPSRLYMGDSWQHTLRIDKTLAAEPNESYPRLIDGAGRCPPEDCGGIGGFYALLEVMNDPQHPDHDDLRNWYGGPFDPTDMGVTQIKDDLARIAARRKRPAVKP
jgi:hypothetical protein